MTCKECRHCKRCPERSREIPCRDFKIKRELIKERGKMNELAETMLNDIDRIKAENEELKRILKMAVEEIERLMRSLCRKTQYQPKREPCNECLYKFLCKDPENYVERPRWGGAKTALRLIGDDKNA